MDLEIKNKADKLEQRAGLEQETLKVEANQDLVSLVKAASFVCSLKEKKSTLKILEEKQKKLEKEYRRL